MDNIIQRIEGFTRDCSRFFCNFNFPREVHAITVNEFKRVMKNAYEQGYNKYCLACTSPGGNITVLYDKILNLKNERGFKDLYNSLGFTICHELSHLEQDLNPFYYGDTEYNRLIEISNDYNTARIILRNKVEYSYLLKKYFNITIEEVTIQNLIDTTDFTYSMFYSKIFDAKDVIERDLFLLADKSVECKKIYKIMKAFNNYTLMLYSNEHDNPISVEVARYHSSNYSLETVKKFLSSIDYDFTVKFVCRLDDSNKLIVSITIL